MEETSIPVNFTVECLEKPLKKRQVTATIRGKAFINKFGLKVGKKIEIKYKRKRVGFAIITDIRLIGYNDLFHHEIINKEGFNSANDLIDCLKPFWKFQWDKIVGGKQRLPFIEFEWM